jgi:hypothetical protein
MAFAPFPFQRSKAMTRNPLRPVFSAACVLALLVLAEKPLSAGSMDPSMTVKENGKDIGTISIKVNRNGAVFGSFEVTLKDPATNKPYTLAGLAKALGEDHFNWFQDYTVSKDLTIISLKDPNKPTGATVSRTYKKGATIIDPQNGGNTFQNSKGQFRGGTWTDGDAPWYYNETAIPAPFDGGKKTVKSEGDITWKAVPGLQLSAKTSGSTLRFADQPNNTDIAFSFTTFLVSVGPGNTYKPLAGFTWTDTFDKSGKGTLTLDTVNMGKDLKPATFTEDMNKEINSQDFGKWTPAKGSVTPEPSTLTLLASGFLGAVPFALRRRNRRLISATACQSPAV